MEGKSSYKGEETAATYAVQVMQVTELMISANDLLALEIYDIDQLTLAVKDIQAALSKFPNLPAGNECVPKINAQVQILDSKKATDTLTEDEIRTLKFDLESSLQSFRTIINRLS